MKILFASPHRDLNNCYRQLLEEDISETITAFDGTQVISYLNTDSFDLLVLDQNIPRIGAADILKKAEGINLKAILLLDTPYDSNSSNYGESIKTIAYPFLPKELISLIGEVMQHEKA